MCLRIKVKGETYYVQEARTGPQQPELSGPRGNFARIRGDTSNDEVVNTSLDDKF